MATGADLAARAARLAEMTTIIRGAGLDGLVRPASQPVDSPSVTNEILPVVPVLRPLLPWGGLRRGTTIAVNGAAGVPAPDPSADGAARSTTPTPVRAAAIAEPAPGRQPHTGAARHPTATPPAHARARLSVVPDGGAPGSGEPGEHRQARPAGATSILLTLLSAASASGSWCAVVGLPALGAVAAGELGVSLDRLALVPYPGPDWPAVVAALLDGFDVVVAGAPGPVGATVASRLAARARQRGSVLVATGEWAGAELVLTPTGSVWEGLGQGRGRLVRRELTIAAQGRGSAAQPRYARLVLPAPTPTEPDQPRPDQQQLDQEQLELVEAVGA